MISIELGKSRRPTVVLTLQPGSRRGAWAQLQSLLTRGSVGGDADSLEVRAEAFYAELAGVGEARRAFGERIVFGPRITEHLTTLAQDRRSREAALTCSDDLSTDGLADELAASGFVRILKTFQLGNLARLLVLPHGADFSVPGAGKTTVALANFALQRARGTIERLLVVAPIAAFETWKSDSAACLFPPPRITVYGGAGSAVPRNTEMLLINYNRLASDYERIREFVASAPTQVVLDEAHRVKRGADGVHGRAVLDLAYTARRRDILTGTPAPQGAGDLIALIRFLYPGQDRAILPADAYTDSRGRDLEVVRETSRAIQRYFVRTLKSDLRIPDPTWEVVAKPLSPIQGAIYEALLGRYRGSFALSNESRRQLDKLGRVVMYLLEAATNPALLTAGSDEEDEQGFAHPPLHMDGHEPIVQLLSRYAQYEKPWKYEYIHEAVRAAAARGEKVLVWSTFVRNLKILARELAPFNPAVVHGGVPPEDSSPRGAVTREAELNRFRTDPSCAVLLANPAAAGEGVSLHHWCHHAIYLDRTFNAGHFLQSQDRIHRLGLAPEVVTRFTLLVSQRSIDVLVDDRLHEKVGALARLMNDPGLVRVALPESDEDHLARATEEEDSVAILEHLGCA